MCVGGALSLVAAVPIRPEDEPTPFWLTRLFGSGRRQRKPSRDIGTFITESQLLLETPPVSPSLYGSPLQSPGLPDLITSCTSAVQLPPGDVFVFPELPAAPVQLLGQLAVGGELPADLRERLGLPAEQLQRPGPEEPHHQQVEWRAAAGPPASPPHQLPAAVRPEVRDAGASLRQCAEQLERCRSSSTAAEDRRQQELQLLVACCLVCVAAGCMCRRVWCE